MFNVAVRLLNSIPEAEDVLQESFISAFKSILQLRENAGFVSWLKKIVINKSLDVLRKRNLRFTSIDGQEIREEEPIEMEAEYTVEAIRAAVLKLPDGYRVILTLYLFEDYTHQMIANKLGISEGTSKSQYARAKKKLIKLLTPEKYSHE